MPAELGEMDGRNAAAATVGLVNGKNLFLGIHFKIAWKAFSTHVAQSC